jgi:hypothetical protein
MLSVILAAVSWVLSADAGALLGIALVVLFALAVRQSRVRARRRWLAALDAFAERESSKNGADVL